VPKNEQKPHDNYSINDWNWEFLRRNPRYRSACKAIEWLKQRGRRKNTSLFFKGFGLIDPVHYMNLTNSLKSQLALGDPELRKSSLKHAEPWSLPSPDMAAHKFKYSPVRVLPVIDLYDHSDFGVHYSGHPYDEEPGQLTAGEHQVIAVIDTRCKLEEIISELKTGLSPYLAKGRNQISKYKDYLAVWDLRQKGRTADEIAPELWPEENESKGGRDFDTGEKGPLIQRVYDHEKAAQDLIDKKFPLRRQRKLQIKK